MPTRTTIVRQSNVALNLVNDAAPGGAYSDPSFSTIGLAPGQLGQIVEFNNSQVPYDSATGTLYGGKYQYVKFKASPTTPVFRGAVVVWSDRANYEVSADQTDALSTDVAGVCIYANTSGYYGWIQISGRATVKFKSSTTKTTPAAGDTVVNGLDADNGLADVLDDATAVTWGTAATESSRAIGILGDAISSQLAVVDLKGLSENN